MLNDKQLWEAWQLALREIQEKVKKPHENDKVFLARCWEEGILQALKKAGYVCLKQDSSG